MILFNQDISVLGIHGCCHIDIAGLGVVNIHLHTGSVHNRAEVLPDILYSCFGCKIGIVVLHSRKSEIYVTPTICIGTDYEQLYFILGSIGHSEVPVIPVVGL